MRYERKLQYQKQRIIQLEERIDELEQDNECLTKEIERLKLIDNIHSQELTIMREEYDESRLELLKEIEKTKTIYEKYTQLLISVQKSKTQYEKEMKRFFKKLQKDIN